jgi:hypothetical protein
MGEGNLLSPVVQGLDPLKDIEETRGDFDVCRVNSFFLFMSQNFAFIWLSENVSVCYNMSQGPCNPDRDQIFDPKPITMVSLPISEQLFKLNWATPLAGNRTRIRTRNLIVRVDVPLSWNLSTSHQQHQDQHYVVRRIQYLLFVVTWNWTVFCSFTIVSHRTLQLRNRDSDWFASLIYCLILRRRSFTVDLLKNRLKLWEKCQTDKKSW